MILLQLPEYTYRNIWNASVPESDPLPVDDVVEFLKSISQYYDHISLKTEITSQPESRASISFDKNIANLSGVPTMEASIPLSDVDLDYCFQTFLKFLNWPIPKQIAWTKFTNTNPPIDADDINWVVIFHHEDQQTFTFAAERATQRDYRPDIYKQGITRDELNKVTCIRDLEDT